MAEMVICLLVTIATTLGAAGRAAGGLSTLPRTVVDFLGAVVDILEVVTDILETVAGVLGAVADILGGWGGSTSCPSRRHSQPHGATTGHRYSRCNGRGIRPLP